MLMYLLLEWTEEREGKIEYGIYTTLEKAVAAANIVEERGFNEWVLQSDGGLVGTVKSSDGEWPYEVVPFEVDIILEHKYGRGTSNPTTTRHEL